MTSIYRTISLKKVALAAMFAVSAGGVALAADMPVKAPLKKAVPPPFFIVNDTSVTFAYYPDATDPGVAGGAGSVAGGVAGTKNTFARYQGSIDHFDVWEYGTNLIHAEFDQYGGNDPSLGIPGAQGSREFFAVARSTLGLNEITHSKSFSNAITKDISLEVGGNAGVQDDFLDEHTTVGVFGGQFTLNLPGVVNFSVLADKEYTRNNFDSCGPGAFGVAYSGLCAAGGPFSGDREFKWTWRLESFISEPLTFLPPSIPLTFTNLVNVVGPKGTGFSIANCIATGCTTVSGDTKTEVFEEAKLILDSGQVFWNNPGIWETFVGYRYWYNKFGTDHNAPLFATIAPGTSIESTFEVGTTYHFK